MGYESVRYVAGTFFAAESGQSVESLYCAVSAFAVLAGGQSLLLRGFRHPESSPQDLVSLRKRRLSAAALKKLLRDGLAPGLSLYVHDTGFSREQPPRVLFHWHQPGSGSESFFLVAIDATLVHSSLFKPQLQAAFCDLLGTQGGMVLSCRYIHSDGTSLEWAYRNNRGPGGKPAWRYAFDTMLAQPN